METINVKLNIETDVKFVRRIGEKKDATRPLLVGLIDPNTRGTILNNASKLANTQFSGISLVPDLTKRQREEDEEVRKLCETRNRERSGDDLNFIWKPLGPQGSRRPVRTRIQREQEGSRITRPNPRARNLSPEREKGTRRMSEKRGREEDTERRRGGTETDEEIEHEERTGGRGGRGNHGDQQPTTHNKDLKTLKLLYLNAQSVVSKINELKITVCDLQPDIVLITESWCNKNISNSVIKLDGYELCSELRRDRTDTTNGIGGGLLVYVKYGRTVLPCDKYSSFNQFCKFIYKSEKESLNFYLIYRPPSSSLENLSELT